MHRKCRIIFSKARMMRYISHLDLVRMFQRAIRRASIPVKLSEGFTRRIKISISPALKLGLESDSLEARISLAGDAGESEIMDRLNVQFPEGITINSVEIEKHA